MIRMAVCFLSVISVASLQAQQPVISKQSTVGNKEAVAPNALQSLERYDNRQMTFLRAGKSTAAHVTIRDWQIHGRQSIAKFPETGALTVSLQSGRITTTIVGKQQNREPGDYWSIPAGTSMGIEVTSESAILHVVAVRRP